jgi:hypothetical protein
MPTYNNALIHRGFAEVWSKKVEGSIREMLDPEVLTQGLGELGVEPTNRNSFFTRDAVERGII